MALFKFISAIVTRVLFILVSLIGLLRVTWVMKDPNYWLLTLLLLPLVIEMIITLKRRQGKDYKWLSPPILTFLICIIPSIWILELDHHLNTDNERECKKLDSLDNLLGLVNQNKMGENQTDHDYFKKINYLFSAVCSDDWILALHQIVLILVIVGKWLLPLGGGVTRDELSQLLLIFVGTAADILEFTSETLRDVKEESFLLVHIILAVWTWSMLQFPLHLAVVNSASESEGDMGIQEDTLLARHSTDIWSIVEALFIQDGPFLVVRLTVMTHFRVFHQMLAFFAFKNFLVVILNLYRLAVICQDFRPSSHNPMSSSSVP
ncbi:transmembrane protein 26-like [Melanotaenia boesemani]|uniref:transmembrane protein 26-like n=1 Tax=Melanotaenia boesemani TaxID=1250792 RepID=UPI001C05EC4D|nr:transmembrane protein 26-like [Melanotaenia boesemani]